jgi:dienelactone hydrolase
MNLRVSDVPYEVDGRRLTGFLADGSAGRPVPGILVAHEGRGFSQQTKDRICMLAELGYVAYGPDFFGEFPSSVAHAMSFIEPFSTAPQRYAQYGSAALDVLRTHPAVDADRLGAIGFCWGAYMALKLACVAPLRCVVGFHPGVSLGPLGNPQQMKAKVLICVGDRDPHVPKKDYDRFVEEMTLAGIDHQMLLLGGAQHCFTYPGIEKLASGPGMRYDPVADRRSWNAMRALFDEAL